MEKKTIYLHIGLSKTGSTSIQEALMCLKSELAKRSIFFMRRYDITNILFTAWSKGENPEAQSIRSLKQEIEVLQEKTIILSCESYSELFYADHYEYILRLAKFFAKCFENCHVKVIVYLRRQDFYFESFYAQHIKTVIQKITFKDELDRTPRENMLWSKLLDAYAKAFGKENCIVRVFEREQLREGDSVKDFFHIVGLDDLANIQLPNNKANVSLSEDAFKVINCYNNKLAPSEEEKRNHLKMLEQLFKARKISANAYASNYRYVGILGQNTTDITWVYNNALQEILLANERNRKKIAFMLPEQRKEFLAYYAEDNALVAKKYLGREDGILFHDTSFPENIINPDEVEIENLIAITIPALIKLQEENNQLKQGFMQLKQGFLQLQEEIARLKG